MSIAIKRLQNELKDFNNPTYSDFFVITPQENPLEWHFTMKGGKGTDYSEGIYHGRIVFPENYPNSNPPKIFFLNQSGRFEIGVQQCIWLNTHDNNDKWDPAHHICGYLMGLYSFFESSESHTGRINSDSQTRQKLAKESINFICPTCKEIKSLFNNKL